MVMINHLSDWLYSTDCRGNRLIQEWEIPLIFRRLNDLEEDDLIVIEGDLEKDYPNAIIVDITHLVPDEFHPGKEVRISLAHFIRPCPCGCHEYQYECYIADCDCCSGDCT